MKVHLDATTLTSSLLKYADMWLFHKYRLLTEVFHNFDELLHNSCFQGYNISYILL